MKDLLKKYWMPIVIAALILFIAISGIVSNCNGKQVKGIMTQADVDTKLNNQKTELETKFYTMIDDTLKKVQDAAKLKSDNLKPIIIYRQAKAGKLVDEARKDTATSDLCDSAMTAQEQVISDMGIKAKTDSIQLDACGKRLAVKDSINTVFRKSNDEKDRINETLNKAITKAQKGKNTKWYFFGIGAILSYLIVK